MPQQDWPELKIRAVDEVLDRVREVRVVRARRPGRLPPSSRPSADEALGGGALHGVAAGDRAGEGDEVDARVAR